MIVAMVPRVLSRSDLVILVGGGVAVVLAGVTRYAAATPAVLAFVTAAIAVALLASLVARSVEQLGDRFGPGGTGVLQSALGNLPELFIGVVLTVVVVWMITEDGESSWLEGVILVALYAIIAAVFWWG